jgi:fucose 4-O-acetylase-like acetyltransferase
MITKERLQWLDALRGLTMILVVANHVAQMCYGINVKTSASLPFFVLFRMPLFFFVSGFLVWKPDMLWTPVRLGMMVWKKFKVQMIPTLVFLCVYIVVRRPHFWDAFIDIMQRPTKGGYWFTWALLIMFIVYFLFSFLESKLKWGRWAIWILWIACLFVYETSYLPKVFTYPKSDFMQWSSLIQVIYFMHFFVFGNIVARNWLRVERLLDTRGPFIILILVAFFSTADALKWHTLRGEWLNLSRTVAMYSLMMIIVMTFRHYHEAFSQKTRGGRLLQYIGTRTLDVYLLHYIFMPKLPQVGRWMNANQPNFLVEQLLTIGMALLVVAMCCVVSHVLRVSPVLKKYLFGRSTKLPDVSRPEAPSQP